MTVVYGIKNCDKCRATLRWLSAHDIQHTFHDVRADGLTREQVTMWMETCGTELINKRSTTWRGLSETERSKIETPAAFDLLLENPTLIKRPLVQAGAELLVGYDESAWEQHFKN